MSELTQQEIEELKEKAKKLLADGNKSEADKIFRVLRKIRMKK